MKLTLSDTNIIVFIIIIIIIFRKEGLKQSEYTKLREYLYPPPSDETQQSTTLLATLQG